MAADTGPIPIHFRRCSGDRVMDGTISCVVALQSKACWPSPCSSPSQFHLGSSQLLIRTPSQSSTLSFYQSATQSGSRRVGIRIMGRCPSKKSSPEGKVAINHV